ncbi:MAG: rod shape-determining protein MreC [Patescibacteria group bacterium]
MPFSFIASLFLSILLTIGSFLNLTPPLSSLLFSLTSPLLQPLTTTRSVETRLFHFISLLPTISSENTKLKNENNLLKIKLDQATQAVNDQTLVASLGNNRWQVQPVKLVGLGNLVIFTSQDFTAILPGQPVVSGNTLVGLVKEVQKPVIKVIPLNHREIKLAVQLETGAKGDYVYKGSQPYIINLPSDTAFNSKTTVFSLPTEQIPENLVVGQIEKIVTNSANPTKEASLTLDQEINSATDFFIITAP